MKRLILPMFFFLAIPCAVNAELVDRIVAVVNDDTITLSDIEIEGKKYFQEIARESTIGDLVPVLDRARREVLSSLIDKRLIEQRAKELGISVAEDELKGAVARVLEGTGLSESEFSNQLIRQGLTVEKYREDMKWQILKNKVLNFEIRSKVVITEEKAKNHYAKEYAKGDAAEGYHILQIGLRSEGKNRDQVKTQAEQIRNQALAGTSFSELARGVSELPSARDGGDLGYFLKDEMSGPMKDAILALKPGEISPVIATPDGDMQFFKLLSIKEGDVITRAPYASVRDDIMHQLQEQEMQEQFQNWVKNIRSQAFIQQTL